MSQRRNYRWNEKYSGEPNANENTTYQLIYGMQLKQTAHEGKRKGPYSRKQGGSQVNNRSFPVEKQEGENCFRVTGWPWALRSEAVVLWGLWGLCDAHRGGALFLLNSVVRRAHVSAFLCDRPTCNPQPPFQFQGCIFPLDWWQDLSVFAPGPASSCWFESLLCDRRLPRCSPQSLQSLGPWASCHWLGAWDALQEAEEWKKLFCVTTNSKLTELHYHWEGSIKTAINARNNICQFLKRK